MAYLLDTNVISALVRNPQGAVAKKIADVGEDRVFTSSIVSSEVYFGVDKNGNDELRGKVNRIMARLYIAAFQPPADSCYAKLRASMERAGRSVTPNDYFIAAHAVSLDAVLVSGDRAFAHVPDLKLENWLD